MEGDLALLLLSKIERQAHIFPNINHSLVSNWPLCDTWCTVTFKTNGKNHPTKTKPYYEGRETIIINYGISHHQLKIKKNKLEKIKLT